MEKFAYANPATLHEAAGLLSTKWGETELLAGGTDLITLMKEYLASLRLVVNIKNVKELGGVSWGKQGLRIGATATFDEISESPYIRQQYPAIYGAVLGVASPQIRNMGTAAGDLCQRPRCWYFRHGYGLLAKDKDGKALVPGGENRYHAILGNSGPAYFVSASSLGPALIALDAKVRLVSATGSRDLAAESFFVTPLHDGDREIAAKPNEIVTEILAPGERTRNATYEVRHKEALDWPLATASVALKMNGDRVQSARVVLGHVAPAPFIATAAEKYLAGKPVNPQTAEEAAKQALLSATPLSQNAYKVQLARVALKRALLEAVRAA